MKDCGGWAADTRLSPVNKQYEGRVDQVTGSWQPVKSARPAGFLWLALLLFSSQSLSQPIEQGGELPGLADWVEIRVSLVR